MSDPYAQPETAVVRRTVLPRIVGAACVVLLLVGVVAVVVDPNDSSGASPVQVLDAVPDAVRDAGSARMTMTMSVTGAAMSGMAMNMSAEGVVDFVTGAGSFSMAGTGMSFEMVTDGTTLWMKMPAGMPGQPAAFADKWLKMPLPAGAELSAGMFGPGQATSFLDALRGAGGTVVDLGTEEVNGVDAHHYAVSVDLERALAEVPEDQRANAEQAMKMFGSQHMPIDVWLSGDGLPVRMVFDMGGSAGLPVKMHMQMDMTDFGVPVTITPPPADQVVDIGDPHQMMQVFTTQADLDIFGSTTTTATP